MFDLGRPCRRFFFCVESGVFSCTFLLMDTGHDVPRLVMLAVVGATLMSK